jgi:predicted permease
MFEFLRDIQFGARLLKKSPVFTVTAVLLLAIGISANTVIFSLVDALLLRRLPIAQPENLVRLIERHSTGFVTWDLPYELCDALRARDTSLSDVICQGGTDAAFTEGDSTERVRVHLVSPNFFTSLGVRAQLGRLLDAEDETRAARSAVLSYAFWQRRFRRDPSVLGRKITLQGRPFTIVGVSAEGFNGLSLETSPDLRVPAAVDRLIIVPPQDIGPAARPLFGEIFGRLRPGIPLDRASAELNPLMGASYAAIETRMFPAEHAPGNVLPSSLQLESVSYGVSSLRAQFSRGLGVLMAGVALLLVLACANLAGLLAARSATRAGEIGIRLALGAGRTRIVRQLLTEGLLLAIAGGAAGVLLAIWCLPLFEAAIPPMRDRAAVLQPLAIHFHIDTRVLAFTLGITLLTVVLFAMSPALRSTRDVSAALKAARSGSPRTFTRHLILVTQVALCTLILIGAALLVSTLRHLESMDPGFNRDRVVSFSIDARLRGYTDPQTRALSQALLAKMPALPGIASASLAQIALMRGTGMKGTFAPEGTPVQPSDFLNSSMNRVTPGYFETMGVRVLAGRDFNWFDRDSGGVQQVIVNQAFANRFFTNRNPLGRRFGFRGPGGLAKGDHQIIGVVSDAKYRNLREPIQPTVYTAAVDGFDTPFVLQVRTRQPPESIIAPVREVLRSLDPAMPLIEVRTLREEMDATLWQERLLALLSTIFGAIAALLAGIGLYAALDYAVKSRTREIGVRMAIGAQPAGIVRLFSRETLQVAIAGIALGLCAYAVASVWLDRVLYGVSRWDPLAIVLVLGLIVLVAIGATAPAAYRAARVDPSSALRSE